MEYCSVIFDLSMHIIILATNRLFSHHAFTGVKTTWNPTENRKPQLNFLWTKSRPALQYIFFHDNFNNNLL